MKKTVVLILIFILLCTTAVCAKPIYTYSETTPISKSITLTRVQDFHSDYNVAYSYIKVDLTDKDTSLKLLKAENGIDKFDTVKNMATASENVVAALNGDFFSVQKGTSGFSLGIEIIDGELVQSPINPDIMATIAYDGEKVLMNYLDFHIMAVAPNWQYQEVRHLNKHTTYYGDILMYTSEFNGGMSPAPGGTVVEVVVSDGKITEFRREMPPVEIPEDGCVLVVSEGSTMFLANNFKVGDPIKFDYYITPSLENATTAFGGGAMLVTEGKAVDSYSHTVAGNNPRSAIGIDKDGTTLYLVAVDGRQENSRGMRMSALADLMVSLGCYTAVNLDGGGSTNMVASTATNEELHTVNSPTENRKVINAVGVTYVNEKSEADGIILKNDKDAVFIGQPVNFTAALHDESLRPMSDKRVNWQTMSGHIENGVFIPDKAGVATVKATYENLSAEKQVYVIDKISGINSDNYISMKKGETKKLNISVFDSAGNNDEISNFAPFTITSSNPQVVTAENGVLTAKENGNGIITIEKDGVKTHISVYVGEETLVRPYLTLSNNIYADECAGNGSKGTLKIGALFGSGYDFLSSHIDNKTISEVTKAEQSFLISKDNGFFATEYENTAIINLVTKNGGIRNSMEGQWDRLVTAIEETQKENVFIMADSSIFGSSQLENRVITDYLSSLDKNVIVVTGGERNTYHNINGVKFFTLLNIDKEKLSGERLKNYSYLEFYFDDEITFKWKSLF